MKLSPALSYSVRRIGLFVATVLFLAMVLPGANPILVLALATVVSGLLSYYLLAGPRKEMARSVEKRVKGLAERIDEKTKAEDAALDAAEAAARLQGGSPARQPAAPQQPSAPPAAQPPAAHPTAHPTAKKSAKKSGQKPSLQKPPPATSQDNAGR